MKKILNPILKDGQSKVKCLHFYERTLLTKTDYFEAIFVYENKIYLYIVENMYLYNGQHKNTLIKIGESEPLNMEKALKAFKNNII